MKIVDLELTLVQLARSGTRPPLRSLVIRLVSEQGVDGWGECSLTWRPDELEGRRQWLLQALAGREIWAIKELVELDVLDQPALRAGVELAAWDLAARTLRQPVAHLWGGFYRARVPLAVRLEPDEPLALARQARELADQQFRTLVWPLRSAGDDDLAGLAALGEVAADHATIRADAAGRLGATELASLSQHPAARLLELLVDPLPGTHWDEWSAARRQGRLRLGLARAITRPAVISAAAAGGASDAALVDLERVGGPGAFRECVATAAAAGWSVGVDQTTGVGLGLAARLHLVASLPACRLALESDYHTLAVDVLSEPLALADGMLVVPTGPGWGVDIDRAKLERYQVG